MKTYTMPNGQYFEEFTSRKEVKQWFKDFCLATGEVWIDDDMQIAFQVPAEYYGQEKWIVISAGDVIPAIPWNTIIRMVFSADYGQGYYGKGFSIEYNEHYDDFDLIY